MEPREIIGFGPETPVLDPVTGLPKRDPKTGAVPVRRRFTYDDGSFEVYEYDARNPPPSPGMPWGVEIERGNDPAQASAARARRAEEAKANAPSAPTTRESARGLEQWNPATQTWEPAPGFPAKPAPAAPVATLRDGVWYGPEGAEIPQPLGTDPLAIQEQQRQAQRQAAADALARRTAERQDVQLQIDALKWAVERGDIDAKRQQELEKSIRDWQYKVEVEVPAQQRAAEDVLRQAAITRGQTAGAAAVSDITAQLPYRYSPGFSARMQQVGAQAARGNYLPGIYQSIARPYRGPDLTGARQQAEQQYERQYLRQFDFDPMEAAGQVGYRMAGPTAAPVTGRADDEEYLKLLGRQLAGAR